MMHSEIQESIPLLALGGLDAVEQARLEQHLAVCPACRALLAEYHFVAEELNAQVPPQTIPAELEAKLMRQLPPRAPRQPNASSAKMPSPQQPNFWRQPVRVSRFAFALTVVLILALGVTAAAFALQWQSLRAADSQVVAQPYTLENLEFISLSGAPGGPDGYICLARDNKIAMLWITKMDALDADHIYQLWLIKGGQRTSGGIFRPGADGRAIVLVNAQEPWGNYEEVGVTIEPAGGSPKPTTPRIIGGKLN
jgi:anti-sigma-K factor RskA